ncbi:MAG TPA: RNA methyltransferase [Candidatus Polarisedimenticolia bacterium]|jgi:TrmH family RNA methyltransferase|nr:RNA methyltransferase [Candidatus Polarisedimenticolia bacterium]
MKTRPLRPAEVVRSPQHPIVKEARRLDADAAARRKEKKGIAWGRHLALEALDAAVAIETALLSPDLEQDAEGKRIVAAIARTGARVVRVTPALLDGIAAGAGDQGVALVVGRPATSLDDLVAPRRSLLLLAHGIQDPGNLGSILRSARSLGAEGVAVLEGSADPWSSRALRAAMGATFRLPVVESTTALLLPRLQQAGLRLVAAVSSEGPTPDRIDLKAPVALLLGREGSGLPEDLVAAARDRVRIPMSPGADSLNVHAAAAILLYETHRQRTSR